MARITTIHGHTAWDNSLKPVLSIKSGEIVDFDIPDCSGGAITRDATAEDFKVMRPNYIYGPIHVEACQAGDVLEIELLSLTPRDWAWTAIIPNFGLLANEYETRVKIVPIKDGLAHFSDKIRIRIAPFMGEIGVARALPGAHSTVPPYRTGGNLDTKHMTEGCSVFLPVEVDGALLSIGDPHAGQGDGEVAGTALETGMKLQVKVTVHKDKAHLTQPHYTSGKAASTHVQSSVPFYATTGVSDDLMEASKMAIREMIKYLVAIHGMEDSDAYMLCSLVVDLKIAEIVDWNYVVAAHCPLYLFD